MTGLALIRAASFSASAPPAPIAPGQVEYTTAGTYSWVVPTGVTSISAVLVGAGGPGYTAASFRCSGGGGGGLRYINNLPVTPGETLTVVVGAAGTQLGSITFSGSRDSQLLRSANVLVQANGGGNPLTGSPYTGGSGGSGTSTGAGPFGGTIGGGNGGAGGTTFGSSGSSGGGGGGGGGYAGTGGTGGAGGNTTTMIQPTAGAGGAGGGGGAAGSANSSQQWGTGGGGVGILGQGTNGSAGTSVYSGSSATAGGGGSGGSNGAAGSTTASRRGGSYGAGGGGYPTTFSTSAALTQQGAVGAVRIIWAGTRPGDVSRSFPSTNTGNL